MDLAKLLSIQNDYILAEDAPDVLTAYCDIAELLDKKHGVDKLQDYAEAEFKKRHPDYFAKNTDGKVGGE